MTENKKNIVGSLRFTFKKDAEQIVLLQMFTMVVKEFYSSLLFLLFFFLSHLRLETDYVVY